MPGYVPLPGSRRMLLPNSRPVGPIDPSEIDSLTVRVRSSGDVKALEAKVNEMSKLPVEQRQYSSYEDLERQTGASQADLDLVEKVAQQHNLVVVHRSAAERSIVLRGRLGDLLNAFPADVQLYHHSTGSYRDRTGVIQIPSELE